MDITVYFANKLAVSLSSCSLRSDSASLGGEDEVDGHFDDDEERGQPCSSAVS